MIYAVNKRTKEHRRDVVVKHPDWVTVEATPDGWIEWHATSGAKPPVANRNGCGLAVMRLASGEEVDAVGYWDDTPLPKYRVVAYRPILAQPDIDITRLVTERHPPAWDGSGMPPVGCDCECYIPSRDCWTKVRIVAHDADVAIFKNGVGHLYAGALSDLFRPIRSEEDRAVEAMLALDDYDTESYNSGMMSRDDFCRALYRAGYRKQEVE